MHRLQYAVALSVAATIAIAGFANACTIDGKPSVYANSLEAVLAPPPTAATYAWWAHFAFPRQFRVGQRILLREDDAQVRKVLPSLADLHRAWRWRFGDGSARVADSASHVYRHPGHYKISVEAYFPHYGWAAFDSVSITLR